MVAVDAPGPVGDPPVRTPRGEFAPDLTGRPVWRLLARGVGLFLPEWRMPPAAVRVGAPAAVTPPVFLDRAVGFGLHLRVRSRARGLEPDREIYVRGRETQTYGVVIAGPSAAVGTRVVDAAALVRYARRLVFDELYDPADAGTLPSAVRAVRSIEGAVLLDRAAGVGLCAEVDAATGAVTCPLAVRFGEPGRDQGNGGVHAYAVGSWAAQSVSSHT
ncbi:MAG TPA: hypothetical protein VHJ17_00520 [Thermomonospora sp.]|nr:hypothetical protein [Thermomonospora sp.]